MRFDPLPVFKGSSSPAGLYARKKWLDEAQTPAWRNDFDSAVSLLMSGQSADGSWSQNPIETVRRLFGLHLTVRDRTERIDKALKGLIEEALNHNLSEALNDALPPEAFRELPFIPAQDQITLICATLFLACVFGLENEGPVVAHYPLLTRWLDEHADHADVWADKSNILRALIVHPGYAANPAALKLVDDLAEIQKPSGLWPAPIPFFLTLNALAHLEGESAHRQWLKALPLLTESQKKDGSWGQRDPEWNTFLVVHALKNKKCL